MAISAESVKPEIAVHLRPTWSEECEEIICLFILHLLKYTSKVLMAQGGIRVFGGRIASAYRDGGSCFAGVGRP